MIVPWGSSRFFSHSYVTSILQVRAAASQQAPPASPCKGTWHYCAYPLSTLTSRRAHATRWPRHHLAQQSLRRTGECRPLLADCPAKPQRRTHARLTKRPPASRFDLKRELEHASKSKIQSSELIVRTCVDEVVPLAVDACRIFWKCRNPLPHS